MFLLLLLLLPTGQVWAGSRFIEELHRAQSRREADERAEYYGRALEAWQPSDGQSLLAECRYRRGEALFELGRGMEAVYDLSKSLELDSGNARAYLVRGQAELSLKRVPEAVNDLEEYAQRGGEDIEGLLVLGETRLAAGRHYAALKAYRRAAELSVSDFRPLLGFARVWMAQKKWDRALDALTAADQLAQGGSPEVLSEMALCQVALGSPEKGRASFDKAIPLSERILQDLRRSQAGPTAISERQGQVARAYYGRGRIFEFLFKLVEAMTDYKEACRLGHEAACDRAGRLAAEPQAGKAIKLAEEPGAAPTLKPKPRRRSSSTKSDAGDRIYGN